jgi:hypothetical protein
MNEKFDPAPFDKYAADPKKAIEIDRVVDQQRRPELLVARFPHQIPSPLRNPHPRYTMNVTSMQVLLMMRSYRRWSAMSFTFFTGPVAFLPLKRSRHCGHF